MSTINAPASNSSTQIYGNITGLQPNTLYTFYGFAQAANGLYYPAGSGVQVRTQSDIPPPPSTPSHAPIVSNRLDRGFDLYWGSASGASWYEFQYKLTSTSTWTTASSYVYGTTYRLTGLQYGYGYDFRVRAVNDYGSSSYTGTFTATVNPQTPTISVGNVGATSITINIGSISGNYSRFSVTTSVGTRTTTSNSVTFTGLATKTQYRFTARSELDVSGTTLSSVNFAEVYGTTGDNRPANFSWSAGHDIRSGQPFHLTASEWTRLQNKVNEFRIYKGLTAFVFYDHYVDNSTFTRAVRGQPFYAYHYNQVRNAIRLMTDLVGPPIAESTDNIIAGSTVTSNRTVGLNGLINALNSIT